MFGNKQSAIKSLKFNSIGRKILILVLLLIGVVFRLNLTADNNFLFNMDSARDMIDVREMVELGKPRLTGPWTAIDGVSNGPGWYYLLSIPYLLSGGSPYAAILLQIILWAVGGFFLLFLASRFGYLAIILIGSLWISSNFLVLSNLYIFNPTPIIFLTPLFIFLLEKYLLTKRLFFSLAVFLLGGFFFQMEMSFGIFIPLVIVIAIIVTDRKMLFSKNLWMGVLIFGLTFTPQILFNFKHDFIMIKSILGHIQRGGGIIFPLSQTIHQVFEATFFNSKLLVNSIILGFLGSLFILKYRGGVKKNLAVLVAVLIILVPLICYRFLPISVSPWHLGAEVTALIFLTGVAISQFLKFNIATKFLAFLFLGFTLYLAIFNLYKFYFVDQFKPSNDPAVYKNQLKVIDFVYQKADGKNFKVYTYMPSVYDYPYQYLFYWYGLKKYGYLPIDYSYLPDKPEYIKQKARFLPQETDLLAREDSKLVFLIKEPDRNYTRPGWEGEFIKMPVLSKEIVGPLEVETRKEF